MNSHINILKYNDGVKRWRDLEGRKYRLKLASAAGHLVH